MQPVKTMGIVVRSTTVGDYNKMLSVLSKDFGRISVWVKGGKSRKHEAASSMSPLVYSEFVLIPKGDVYTLSSATLTKSFYGLRNSVESLAYAMYFLSLADSLSVQDMDAGDILKVLLNCLYFLENGMKNSEDLRLCFELCALSVSGYAPTFNSCCRCGSDRTEYFDVAGGGMICLQCADMSAVKISAETAELMEFYSKAPLKDALYRKGDPQAVKEGICLCEKFIKNHIGNIPTLDYLKGISGYSVSIT